MLITFCFFLSLYLYLYLSSQTGAGSTLWRNELWQKGGRLQLCDPERRDPQWLPAVFGDRLCGPSGFVLQIPLHTRTYRFSCLPWIAALLAHFTDFASKIISVGVVCCLFVMAVAAERRRRCHCFFACLVLHRDPVSATTVPRRFSASYRAAGLPLQGTGRTLTASWRPSPRWSPCSAPRSDESLPAAL